MPNCSAFRKRGNLSQSERQSVSCPQGRWRFRRCSDLESLLEEVDVPAGRHLARSCSSEQISLPAAKCNGLRMTFIEIRPCRDGWQVYRGSPRHWPRSNACCYRLAKPCWWSAVGSTFPSGVSLSTIFGNWALRCFMPGQSSYNWPRKFLRKLEEQGPKKLKNLIDIRVLLVSQEVPPQM